MKEKKYGPKTDCWYRSPKTTQERKWNYAHGKKYVRAKRYGHNLPSTYDDIAITKEKCWKSKRKNQYRTGKRGKKHVVILPVWVMEYYITSYFDDHDIPYKVEDLRESKMRKDCYVRTGYWKYSWSVGTKLTYWTDKNIQFPNEAFQLRRSYLFR